MATSVATAVPTTSQQWNRLVVLHARIENSLAVSLQNRHQIGLSEFRALRAIANSPTSELRLQELAEVLNLNQSSISRLVGRLELAGLTVRDICTDDRRGVYSVITDSGRQRLSDAAPTYDQVLAEALEKAGREPELGGVVAALELVSV